MISTLPLDRNGELDDRRRTSAEVRSAPVVKRGREFWLQAIDAFSPRPALTLVANQDCVSFGLGPASSFAAERVIFCPASELGFSSTTRDATLPPRAVQLVNPTPGSLKNR
jgi:hypothetical protein